MFTLYAVADPDQLGEHRYADRARHFETDESERGILYTTRAGFLDLAHLRLAIDWTRYCTLKMRDALADGQSDVALNGSNGSMFHVRLHYPLDWDDLSPAAQHDRAAELALASGQRLAYLMLVWHEIASWYGDRNFVFDESPSAFTYDDSVSHVIGIRVAAQALRDAERPFDEAATDYLRLQLKSVGVVGPAQTQQAVDAVEGLWWTAGRPLKRQLDVGLPGTGAYDANEAHHDAHDDAHDNVPADGDGVISPWLVAGVPFATDHAPEPFAVPRPVDLPGPAATPFFTVRIDPRIPAADAMRRRLAASPEWFTADKDLPRLLTALRQDMITQFGPTVTDPTPPRRPMNVAAAP